jgi:hypothetical protein
VSARAVAVASRVALLVTLLGLSVYLTVRPTLASEDTFEKGSPITEVVKRGPVVIEDVEWKLDSLQVYTQLVGERNETVEVDVPDNAIIVLAKLSLTPTDRARLDDGFYCEPDLADDRGNYWEDESVFGIDLPTYCGDDDLKVERGKTVKVAKVYVVPKSAVPHLIGLVTPETGNTSAERRVLITP